MAMSPRVWDNPQRPDNTAGPRPVCPRCGSALVGPFAAYDENNQSCQKTACSRIGCAYIARMVYGFGTMKDADTVSFK